MKSPLVKSPGWLDTYYSRVSGSTAAASVGLSPFETRSGLAVKMRDPALRDDLSSIPAIRRGVFGETAALFALQEATGREIEPHPQDQFVYHDDYPHAHCLPDGHAGERRICEVKVVSWAVYNRIREHGIPQYYVIQALHNLAVTDSDECDFGVLYFEQQKIYCETICRNDQAIAALMRGEADFLDAVNSEGLVADATVQPKSLTGQEGETRIITDLAICKSAAEYIKLKRQYSELEAQIESIKESLQEVVGQCEYFEFEGAGRGTWKTSKAGQYFDHAAAITEDPSLSRFLKFKKPARPFLLKPLKGE